MGLDEQQRKIIRELIRNPRISDNKISKRTGIPVMTVNRKRKLLEEKMIIRYYMSLDKGEFGMHIFRAKNLYVIKFKIGITREQYLRTMEIQPKWRHFNSKYVSLAYLGEKEGHLALMIILDARDESHLVEEFNGKIVPFLREKLGDDCIEDIETTALSKLIRVHHNYLPYTNIEKGKIKDSWSDNDIFVDEVE
ncbi:MAG: Lrp/AsnC family transcriptional regulator [Candidatus Aenigmarchaeota archaeon]|nr:Lrp/AsnC family transcriptional regulator [Candidatus Aenigmarchaeota archaeon]